MRIRHLAVVTQDLEAAASFYEEVFGFRRIGTPRKPRYFEGVGLELSNGDVNFQLLQPDDPSTAAPWSKDRLGPNHIGIEVEDPAGTLARLEKAGVEVFNSEDAPVPRYFMVRDPDGTEVDVVSPDVTYKV